MSEPAGTQELARLMVRVVDGDEAAFAALYDATSAAAFGLALRVTNSHHLAEEVLQEVFLHVWQNAAAFDVARGKAKSWILMLVHRRAVDCVRSVRAATARDIADGTRNAASLGSDMADDLHLRRAIEQLRVHMTQLTEAQQLVISLAYVGGYSQAEIADRLGHPLGTVKSRMRDALTRLRRAAAAAA
ncbi:sigma-70 family RNA polymerase sigma factor [Microbacterium oleivorans]|uniref:Sigma-70 family RNA polymerase sigma factor n=2 Tax=Microbacterium oleivorans TaxID=273677 RepID=A0A7D5IY20_9MICO|nr:sigma-70 family RNA polymerase sigma factor [Microbacterium oleivorans]